MSNSQKSQESILIKSSLATFGKVHLNMNFVCKKIGYSDSGSFIRRNFSDKL